jgi:hypothetical protein
MGANACFTRGLTKKIFFESSRTGDGKGGKRVDGREPSSWRGPGSAFILTDDDVSRYRVMNP